MIPFMDLPVQRGALQLLGDWIFVGDGGWIGYGMGNLMKTIVLIVCMYMSMSMYMYMYMYKLLTDMNDVNIRPISMIPMCHRTLHHLLPPFDNLRQSSTIFDSWQAASVVEKLKGLQCQAAPGCLVWQCPGCPWAAR